MVQSENQKHVEHRIFELLKIRDRTVFQETVNKLVDHILEMELTANDAEKYLVRIAIIQISRQMSEILITKFNHLEKRLETQERLQQLKSDPDIFHV